jgi:hypothetical protein
MKCLALRSSRGCSAHAETQRETPRRIVLGSIPGLERLLPGCYLPGETVRSQYGRWTLPRSFKGRPILLILNGTIFGCRQEHLRLIA